MFDLNNLQALCRPDVKLSLELFRESDMIMVCAEWPGMPGKTVRRSIRAEAGGLEAGLVELSGFVDFIRSKSGVSNA